MHFIAYILMGLIAGFIASKIVNKSGEGVIMDTLIGVVGAAVGGWLVGFMGWAPSGHPLGVTSILVAVLGSIVLLLIWRAVKSAM